MTDLCYQDRNTPAHPPESCRPHLQRPVQLPGSASSLLRDAGLFAGVIVLNPFHYCVVFLTSGKI